MTIIELTPALIEQHLAHLDSLPDDLTAKASARVIRALWDAQRRQEKRRPLKPTVEDIPKLLEDLAEKERTKTEALVAVLAVVASVLIQIRDRLPWDVDTALREARAERRDAP